MRIVAFTLSAAVAVLGGIGVVAPDALQSVAEFFLTRNGLYLAAALRIVLGTAFFVAAPGSRLPTALRTTGVFIVVAGLATPLMGVERARTIVAWETAHGPTAMPRGSRSRSSQRESRASGSGKTVDWWTRIAHSIWVQVVPLLTGVHTRMSPARGRNPSQRVLSKKPA